MKQTTIFSRSILLSLLLSIFPTWTQQTISSVNAEVSVGDLVDKITILEIKTQRIKDETKLKNIRIELETLYATYKKNITDSPELTQLTDALRKVNETLWVLEDSTREKEAQQQFDAEFIQLARSVYLNNDERGRIKRDINRVAGSRIVEEKSYTEYRDNSKQPSGSTKATHVQAGATSVTTEVAVGELVDKITILEIKLDRITDEAKLKNIRAELETLYQAYTQIPYSEAMEQLKTQIRQANAKMWDIQDAIREKERTQTFDQEFINLARGNFYTNDARCRVKRAINELAGSRIMEEKVYTEYRKA